MTTPNQRSDMTGYGGQPANPQEQPQRAPDPVDDNPNPPPAAAAPSNDDEPSRSTQPNEPPRPPKGPPSDDARDRIAQKFRKVRAPLMMDEPSDLDFRKPENVYGRHALPAADETAAAPAAEEHPAPATQAPRFKLKVDGEEIDRDLAEVARLADMTVEEVEANPERATRYAQKELASSRRLDKAKDILRGANDAARTNAMEAPRSQPSVPDQGPQSGDNASDRPPGNARSQSDDDRIAALVEEMQLGDPKEAGKKLRDTIASIAAEEAEARSRTVVSQARSEEAYGRDQRDTNAALQKWGQEHADVAGNPYLRSAILTAAIDEMRTDLANTGVPDDILAKATPDQLRTAHAIRRVNGDAGIRKLDQAFFDAAHARMTTGLNLPASTANTPPRSDLAASREARKQDLQPQPRRAGVPPQTPKPSQQPMSMADVRKAAVRKAQQSRGQRPSV